METVIFATFITGFLVAFFFFAILISREFGTIGRVPALAGAIFIGLCFLAERSGNRLQEYSYSVPSRRRKTRFQHIRRQIWIILPEILSGLFVGLVMYFILIVISVNLLHTIAPKEAVQFDVVVTSTGNYPEEFRKACQYYLRFDVPKISPAMQSVCFNKDQWLELRKASYPMTVHPERQRSYFGYVLRYTK